MAQARQLVLTEEQQRDLLDCREHHPKAYMREKAAAILKVEASASGAAGRRSRRTLAPSAQTSGPMDDPLLGPGPSRLTGA